MGLVNRKHRSARVTKQGVTYKEPEYSGSVKVGGKRKKKKVPPSTYLRNYKSKSLAEIW